MRHASLRIFQREASQAAGRQSRRGALRPGHGAKLAGSAARAHERRRGMAAKGIAHTLGQQEWLGPLADTLQQAVGGAFGAMGPSGQAVKDFLHGVWLGHPLHPALTDLPVGAWTVALALDALESLSGRDELGPGADAAVALGLAGAVGAAATGLTDWRDTDDPARRAGLVHGLLNTA